MYNNTFVIYNIFMKKKWENLLEKLYIGCWKFDKE